MSKRIDKKKLKRQSDLTSGNAGATLAAPVSEPAPSVNPKTCMQTDFFIQYQNQEYLEREIIDKIREKCKAEGTEFSAAEKLCVYLKPEEGKAYYTYGDISGFVEA